MRKLIIVFLAFIVFCVIGCEEALRFAPSESIKQTAELTNQMARKINTEGTVSQSPTSRQLVKGTQVSLSYIGRPKEVPDPEQFETVSAQAQTDAEKRPDAWEVADSMMELGIGVCALFSGVAGVKGVQILKNARAKSKALQEVVAGNELFKKTSESGMAATFATSHNNAQSKETKKIVADLKLG